MTMINNKERLVQRVMPERPVEINGQEFLFKEIGYQDIKKLMQLQKEVYRGRIPWSRAAFLEEMNEAAPVFYMMLMVAKEPVAFVTARFAEGVGQISNLVVSSDFQRQGLASFLLEQVKEIGCVYGVEKLTLEVRVSNTAAQELYAKLGFETIDQIENYYYKEKEDAYKMHYLLEEK
ncbi:ribosomal protein S18-alanine N-acetyltransferase [Vagococcus coleopterorum]|uniref:Ribosomal protein S18-alanine N-acetyltransferase n=1 Tax=Vagococcus coleopterorum TaxID=2714946 RepID=A0A6G8AN88_9ENTE|nr:ribosomal protein S18-alanine N-acetyltransferase [Vagococcus coleopterorum]QIL46393.1 ribosomal protein S18-alanine N-acetyltransferase [Vagococcus coleopterorum]